MSSVDELKAKVANLLVTVHDFTFEEAEEAMNKSYENSPQYWNENADPETIANALADDDDNE